MLTSTDSTRALRFGIYGILIAIGLGNVVGRVLSVNSADRIGLEKEYRDVQKRENWERQRPFLSGNDRSRWMTVRALVDHGTYEIDQTYEWPNWDTLDMVRHVGADGKMHSYSSKPPLLATLLAGEYWVIKQVTGWTFKEHPYEIGRFMILSWHLPLLLIFYVLLVKTAERYAQQDWTRIFIVAAGVFGTLLTTFAIALNNHLPGAVCAMVALYCGLRILWDGERGSKYFFLAGLVGAFMVANELPALAAFAVLGAWLLWQAPRPTLTIFTPAALAVAAGFFGTNYLAHGEWRPAYDYRNYQPDVTKPLMTLAGQPDSERAALVAELDKKKLPELLQQEFAKATQFSADTEVAVRIPGQYWWVMDRENEKVYSLELLPEGWRALLWNSWYHYVFTYNMDGKIQKRMSYWFTPGGIDRGEPSRMNYAINVLVGHHGIFSLTPIWILTVIGLFRWSGPRGRAFAASIAAISLVCLTFYIFRPTEDRNYGGTSSGFRWAFWFAPLWLTAMLPALDAAAKARWSRIACLVLLGFSVLSVSYPAWNPWSHPWLWNLSEYLENLFRK